MSLQTKTKAIEFKKQAPPPPTEYGTQPQFHTQVLRTSSTEKILKSPPPTAKYILL